MNNRDIPEKEIEDILKKSILLEPSGEMEDRVMQKINTHVKYATRFNIGKWITIMVYSVIGTIFTYFLFMPETGRSTLNISTDLNRYQIIDPELINMGPSQSYLIMSIVLFAVAVWIIVLFNLPRKDTARKYHS